MNFREGVNRLAGTIEDWDWKLVKCPYCGNYIITQARISVRCQKCGRFIYVGKNTVYSHESKAFVQGRLMNILGGKK